VFKEILDSFTPALVRHLNDEIPTLMALEKYGADKLMKAWKDLEKRILAGALDPVFLLLWSSKWRCANGSSIE